MCAHICTHACSPRTIPNGFPPLTTGASAHSSAVLRETNPFSPFLGLLMIPGFAPLAAFSKGCTMQHLQFKSYKVYKNKVYKGIQRYTKIRQSDSRNHSMSVMAQRMG